MTTAVFYHLTRSSPAETLANLLPRGLKLGWPAMVRGTNPEGLEALDRALWEQPADSFLPHGREGGGQDADQPVLIGHGAIRNEARILALIDGAQPLPEELASPIRDRLERVWVLFDGADDAAVAAARGLWTGLIEAGCGAQYWTQDEGPWAMKTERKPKP